ncbi:aminotransferase class III-fold pyridoxal phosphate-dependent enzyme [Actinokineospora pegani]|uniref:aminotransferase class III-fold pyridoxal phosphate-dependent enzyme n=1 Tax=Actinokineospora pegani TaxID=2654637 RepID=UPI0012EAE751|nr:aminotransferase class III-fold pyridoxal phosphate-dependent enzyme [Actinokineospora pegani]
MTAVAESNAAAIDRARRVTAAERFDVGTRFGSVFHSADGSWMRDLEGNRVLDVTAASGALLLGNRHPAVVEAVVRSVRDHGAVFASTITPQRLELAERLCARYPAGEKAVFCKSGSEATTAAIQIARAATGRDLVLTAGYHGWFEWQRPYRNMGFDPRTRVANFGYSETALRRLLTEFGSDVAAVILTPEPAWFDLEWHHRVSRLCAEHGVLFILDEVITALRWGSRGLNGTGGVRADMVTMSKGIANGHAIAAVLGGRELMDHYDAAGIAGTYNREITPMFAALAVLDEIEDGSVHEHSERMGRALKDGMRDVLASVGIAAHVAGPDMMFDVVTASEELSWDIYAAAYTHGAWFEDSGTQMVTAAFGQAEVDHALEAFEKGARQVAARTDVEAGELPERLRSKFALDAFGGSPVDTGPAMARLAETVELIGRGTPGPGTSATPVVE